ncbi:hypothetical protein NQ317_012200 [Molorchus minor]|uniref:CHK kinase-like domain-containing protein n=1 Tax=Molorchus minor TaxID=1323400 RepID=A0ABQ9K2U2_9CUCU|nr:hypothetical protein NQ317_012200 [Molorchus minor]
MDRLELKTEDVAAAASYVHLSALLEGYTTGERAIGFDLPCAQFLVRNLAYFHAISNQIFSTKKIKPHLSDFIFPVDESGTENLIKALEGVLKENDKCIPYLDRMKELTRQPMLKTAHEPFATMIHNDYWVNNMMLKFENGKPIANKMVDFQVIEYKCPSRDLIFFLFSSVQQKVLEGHLDELIDLYYESLIEKLEELKCDTSPFTRDLFEERLKQAVVEAEYHHINIMLFPILAEASDIKELSDISADDLKKGNEISPALKERLLYVTLECIRKGWLD